MAQRSMRIARLLQMPPPIHWACSKGGWFASVFRLKESRNWHSRDQPSEYEKRQMNNETGTCVWRWSQENRSGPQAKGRTHRIFAMRPGDPGEIEALVKRSRCTNRQRSSLDQSRPCNYIQNCPQISNNFCHKVGER